MNMRLKIVFLFSCLVSCLEISGCVTRGAQFTSDTAWIRIGSTTQDSVSKLLGNPHAVGSASGTPTWTYGYYKYGVIGTNAQKELKLYWNANKTVKDYSFSSSFPADSSAASPSKTSGPWSEP
jgi:outer membrane protein assembly factor BamE (lipoprotein component of BamABCDE complex)